MPVFSQVEAGTLPAFERGLVARTLFTATALLRILRSNKSIFRPWQGGTYKLQPFEVQPVPAGSYSPGVDTFELEEIQTFDDQLFFPRFYKAEVVINAAVTDVYNMGPGKIVDILKEKYGNASNSLDSQVAADTYLHGQPLSSTVTSADGTKRINGFSEALNDGFTPSAFGDVFTSYGSGVRNAGLNGTVLNSIPYWGGNADGTSAAITLQILNAMWHMCKQGKGEGKMIGGKPDYGFTSDFLFGRICGLIFPMQRSDIGVMEPKIGLTGCRFNNSIIFADSYSPGLQNARYIQDASVLPRITTGTFTVPASAATNAAFSNMPTTGTTLNVAEMFTWWRTDSWRFSHPKSGRYAFKNRGLIEAFDGDMLADIIRAAMVLACLVPSSNILSYGFNG